MNIKKINIKQILITCLAFTLFFSISTNIFAQNKVVLVADVNVQNVKVIKQENNVFDISFTLTNGEGVQNGVKYSVRLMSLKNDKPAFIVDEKVYDEVLTLNEKSTTHIFHEYYQNFFSTILLISLFSFNPAFAQITEKSQQVPIATVIFKMQ